MIIGDSAVKPVDIKSHTGLIRSHPWTSAAIGYFILGIILPNFGYAFCMAVFFVELIAGLICFCLLFKRGKRSNGFIGILISFILLGYSSTKGSSYPEYKVAAPKEAEPVAAPVEAKTTTSPNTEEEPNKPSVIGTEVKIANAMSPNGDSPATDSEEVMIVAMDALTNKDNSGMLALVSQGRISILKKGTRVRIEMFGNKGCVKVRVLSGPLIMKDVWVPWFSLIGEESK